LQVDFVYVAPAPVLAGLEGLDDGVMGVLEVFVGVAVLGRIAAADVAADEALAQVNPSVSDFEAILAALAAGSDVANFGYVFTTVGARHGISFRRRSSVSTQQC
jgi:hypothetical protein